MRVTLRLKSLQYVCDLATRGSNGQKRKKASVAKHNWISAVENLPYLCGGIAGGDAEPVELQVVVVVQQLQVVDQVHVHRLYEQGNEPEEIKNCVSFLRNQKLQRIKTVRNTIKFKQGKESARRPERERSGSDTWDAPNDSVPVKLGSCARSSDGALELPIRRARRIESSGSAAGKAGGDASDGAREGGRGRRGKGVHGVYTAAGQRGGVTTGAVSVMSAAAVRRGPRRPSSASWSLSAAAPLLATGAGGSHA